MNPSLGGTVLALGHQLFHECWKKSSGRSGSPIVNKVPHNGFLPIAVPVCSAVQGGESAAAAGERLHFNYGAGCRRGAAAGDSIINDKGSSNIHIDQVALTITTQGTPAIL